MDHEKQKAAAPQRKRKVRRRHTGIRGGCQYREIRLGNGVVFKGLANKRDPLTGDGELLLTNGSIYRGQILKGQPHGQGEMVWSAEASEQ